MYRSKEVLGEGSVGGRVWEQGNMGGRSMGAGECRGRDV